jgi:hypothetical protein
MLKTALAVKGFALRLAYFAIAPFLLVVVTVKLPVLGAIINLVIFLLLLLASGLLPGVGTARFFRRIWRLENYYREHPPKPFLYYVFFPLFAPYWLFVCRARREIFLYRKLSGASLFIMIGLKLLDYRTNWYPTIPFAKFAAIAAGGLLLELLIFLIIIIPVGTTVVTYKLAGAKRRLIVLGIAATLSLVVGVLGLWAAKRPQVRTDILHRMWLRAHIQPAEANAALEHGLDRALAELPKSPNDVELSYKRKGIADKHELAARAELVPFFRPDEAAAFFMFVADTREHERALVIVAQSDNAKQRPSVWRAAVFDTAGATLRYTSSLDDFDNGVIP